jgi:hypothetical protein
MAPASGYAGAKPFLSVLSHGVVIDREIGVAGQGLRW